MSTFSSGVALITTTQPFSDAPLPYPTLAAALQHWSKETPNNLALTSGAEELTYAEFSSQVARCITWLKSHGVVPGDRVVLVGYNTIAWVVHYMATLCMGATIAPANNRLNPSQFADQVEVLEAKIVLRDSDHEEIASLVKTAPVFDVEHPLPSEEDTSIQSPKLEAPALISFTSGTTGKPKGATLSQNALAEASWAFVRVMNTTSADSTLVVVPMFHNTGFIDQFGHMLLIGGRTDLLRKFKTALAIDALTQRPVTYLAAVPSIHRLLMIADGADKAFEKMQILLYGGSPMPANWINELHVRWPQLRLFHGYGLSEYGSAISFLPADLAETHGESVGIAVPETEIRIVGDDGFDVEQGEIGELWAKGPTIMLGYWKQPGLTEDKIRDGWLRTGDLATYEDGLYYIQGRIDDVINRGGEKVLPAHVEGIIAEDSAVAQGIVFPLEDPILQNRVYAVIEERPDTTFDEKSTINRISSRLPDYAVPERIFVVDSLPRTASGKIDRRETAKRFSALSDLKNLATRVSID